MIIKPVERFLAFRYLRARRAEGFISVIAWFSFLGITLGVATLVIVMSVMNGFRAELIERILGLKTVLMGFGLDSDAIHSPNEHYGVFNYFKGVETIPLFHEHFARLSAEG